MLGPLDFFCKTCLTLRNVVVLCSQPRKGGESTNMQPTTQVPETALQAQIRITREKAERAFDKAEAEWLAAEEAHEAEAKALPSYAAARRLFYVREYAVTKLHKALQEEDKINGTNHASREGAEVTA